MRLAYFQGCKIPFYLKSYDTSFRAVMHSLGVELVELQFHCCGYPARSEDFETSIYHSLKNLALAQKEKLDIITPCKCCFGQFKHAAFWYMKNPGLKSHIDTLLEADGLKWQGGTKVFHFLNFLRDAYGVDQIKSRITNRLADKKTVVQYGCHALRPFSITGFDHPSAPTVFESLLELTGVEVLPWNKSHECCGNPVNEFDKELASRIAESKLQAAVETGADYICCACTHCQIQYEKIQVLRTNGTIPTPVLFSQLLGLSLGLKIRF